MNITKAQFTAISEALALLPHGDAFNLLSMEDQDTIVNADVVMIELLKKRDKDNKRTAEYIAGKRKKDRNYAR